MLAPVLSGCYPHEYAPIDGGVDSGSDGLSVALAFQNQPDNSVAGSALAPISITIQDSSGQILPSATDSVTIALDSADPAVKLQGTLTVAAASGIATFSDLRVDTAGDYALRATSNRAETVSSIFNVTADVAAKLSFAVPPTAVSVESAIAPAVRVQIRDAFDNLRSTDTSVVTLALVDNVENASLHGITQVSAMAGVASFGDLWVDQTGTAFSLIATAGSLQSATSATFNVGAPWKSANSGLSGGRVQALAPSSLAATFYAGTVGGVYKTSSGGVSWAAASMGLPADARDVRGLLVDAAAPATVYAATSSGIYKSINSGASWTSSSSGVSTGNTRALAIQPGSSLILYVATAAGVFKTADAGATWSSFSTGLTTLDIAQVAVDPLAPTTIYVASRGNGVFKSTAGGAFAAVNTNLPSGAKVNAIAIDPLNAGTLYAALPDGLYRSTNGGGAWTSVLGQAANGVAIDKSDSTIVYVLTSNGVQMSSNSGGSFSALTGVPSQAPLSIALDATNQSSLLIGFDGPGVFHSADAGATFALADEGIEQVSPHALLFGAASSQVAFAGTWGAGVFQTSDAGDSWTRISGVPNNANVAALTLVSSGATLLAATDAGIFKTATVSPSFVASSTGLGNQDVRALQVSTAIYAGTASGVYQSVNSGTSWTLIGLAGDSVRAIASEGVNLYVGTDAGLFTWNGATFSENDAGMGALPVRAVVLDPRTTSTIFAGTSDGIYRSDDSAMSWTLIGAGLSDVRVLAAVGGSSGDLTLYAGTATGFYLSDTDGATWTTAGFGLPTAAPEAIAVAPVSSSTILIGIGSPTLPAGGFGAFISNSGGR